VNVWACGSAPPRAPLIGTVRLELELEARLAETERRLELARAELARWAEELTERELGLQTRERAA
jgi:hypothetical protein